MSTRRRRSRPAGGDDDSSAAPPPAKRQRLLSNSGGGASTSGGGGAADELTWTLMVRWFGPAAGQTKVTALPLRAVSGVDALPRLGRELVFKAYAPPRPRPDFIASPDFARFTPARECLAVPGDVVRTELRLVVSHGGWEYCVLRHALTPLAPADSNMLVTAIEFEGRPEEAFLGALGFRVSLIAYPIVALRKVRASGGDGGGNGCCCWDRAADELMDERVCAHAPCGLRVLRRAVHRLAPFSVSSHCN